MCPLYDFRCEKCQTTVERFSHRIDEPQECECGATMKKVFTVFPVTIDTQGVRFQKQTIIALKRAETQIRRKKNPMSTADEGERLKQQNAFKERKALGTTPVVVSMS